ncbi:Magnesium transporter MgtE OS=Lysinibacillus sphaericus OX=1421 GN=LS41612_19250 PE=3 SV=1 [Lysinibacillus sphaericus]
MLENNEINAFRDEFLELHPYDQATFYEKVEPDIEDRPSYLSPTEMADIFEAIEIDDDGIISVFS